jgi:serine-type D-Ala-D-Ala carboxypeptidase/endopeptidase (penicillin-binding protein 4)
VHARTPAHGLTRRSFLALGSLLALPAREVLAQGTDPVLARLVGVLAPKLAELEKWVTDAGGTLHVAVADGRTAQELLGVDAATPENPASNQKLITAGAALHYLGPRFTYQTGLYGKVEGSKVSRLVIRGEGDPSFTSKHLELMVKTLFARGVREVGAVLVDQSAFDDSYVPPAFEQQPGEWAAFRAPVSAVAIDGNATTFCVRATKAGEPAQVWFEPAGFVTIDGDVATVAADKKVAPRLTLKGNGQRLSARVAGAVSEGSGSTRWRQRVEDPRWYAGYVLKKLCEQQGIAVKGDVALGGHDELAELATHQSRPLAELLHQLGKKSDNFYSEMLLKTLGYRLQGKPGSSAAGAEAASAWLKQIGAWEVGTRIGNGSGLYDANRVSSRTLTRLLAHTLNEPKLSSEFLDQLAVGGIDGTLASRFYSLKAQRSVLAKTGTLRRVVSLSGYAFGPQRSTPVTFSFIVADMIGRHGEVRKHVDKIVEAMAKELWKPVKTA